MADHDPHTATATSPPRPPLQPPTTRKHSNPFTSTLSYFTEPVSYTISGIVRRLSEDEAPTPLARALSANYNTLHNTSSLYGVLPRFNHRRLRR